MKRFLAALGLLLLPSVAQAGCSITLPFTLQNNTVADANQVMANFNALNTALANQCASSGINSDITALTGAISILGLPGLSAVVVANGPTFNFTGSGLQLTQTSAPWIVTATITTAANDVGNLSAGEGILSATKYTNYSVAGLQPGVASGLFGGNEVNNGVWGNQAGVYGIIVNHNSQHSQPGSTASAVGVYGVGTCVVTACSATWGGLSAAYDTSGQTSATNPLVGFEVDNYAHGDGTTNRLGLHIDARTPDGASSANGVQDAIRISSGGTAAGGGYFGSGINMNFGYYQNAIVMNLAHFACLPANPGCTLYAWLSPSASLDSSGDWSATTFVATPVTNQTAFFATGAGGSSQALQAVGTYTHIMSWGGATVSGDQIDGIGFSLDSVGNLVAHTLRPNIYTVATLPACAPGNTGQIALVNDSSPAPTYNTAIGAGGGVNQALVVCQGNAWAFH